MSGSAVSSVQAERLGGQPIIDCRAGATPETLLIQVPRAPADTATRFSALRLKREHSEHFRPGKPQPTTGPAT